MKARPVKAKPKKKPLRRKKATATRSVSVVSVASDRAMRNLKRILSHALASGLRNVVSFDMHRIFDGSTVAPYTEIEVRFIDRKAWK